jgi:hypothetical protein
MAKFNRILKPLREIIYIWDSNLLLYLHLKKEIINCMLNIDLQANYLMLGKTDQNRPNNQADLSYILYILI